MLPTFVAHPKIALVAATDPRHEAVESFSREFEAKGYDTIEELCADPSVQAVYVASPHQYHVAHVKIAAAYGKHVLVEKPMALSTDDCLEMISAAKAASIHLLVGHSHSYDLPYLKTRELISSGSFGSVRMINAINFTDFLYRPRRPEELDTLHGGGVVFSQAAHQIDIVRLLATSPARCVRAVTGIWDPKRPTEGAYNAQVLFSDASFASLTYSGYAHFDSDEFNGWRGELGQRRDPDVYGQARRALKEARSPEDETNMKNRRAYGTVGREEFSLSSDISHNHFGLFIVSCERADLRPMPNGIFVYGDDERWFEEIPEPRVPRAEVVDELYEAVVNGRVPLHSGQWGLATLEICLAILESAKSNGEISLSYSG
ncbi:4,5-dihydroxyphthalate dehydrogenase [Pseudorhodoplanes sinuspersici]|uniref:4,5-dihydroxyphthalate dehydrogenase n=2 Tax=Pseudorhodoplanes sinuspersici TaxID=1235591 RepID=A0A1W6ZKZ5_9HYPH|nr:4,5-dihydroxyphthalate dehydrogenase [Pseudorhodoplanes sinuspersici]